MTSPRVHHEMLHASNLVCTVTVNGPVATARLVLSLSSVEVLCYL